MASPSPFQNSLIILSLDANLRQGFGRYVLRSFNVGGGEDLGEGEYFSPPLIFSPIKGEKYMKIDTKQSHLPLSKGGPRGIL
jgi:hypothetical protein